MYSGGARSVGDLCLYEREWGWYNCRLGDPVFSTKQGQTTAGKIGTISASESDLTSYIKLSERYALVIHSGALRPTSPSCKGGCYPHPRSQSPPFPERQWLRLKFHSAQLAQVLWRYDRICLEKRMGFGLEGGGRWS